MRLGWSRLESRDELTQNLRHLQHDAPQPLKAGLLTWQNTGKSIGSDERGQALKPGIVYGLLFNYALLVGSQLVGHWSIRWGWLHYVPPRTRSKLSPSTVTGRRSRIA
jgi:hypothetical protein